MRTPAFLPCDREAWRALVNTARRAASDPGYCRPLGQAAKHAFRAVMPDQTRDGAAPFCELVRLGQLWPQMTAALRRSKTEELLALARAVSIALGDEPPEDPKPAAAEAPLLAWASRADIGG